MDESSTPGQPGSSAASERGPEGRRARPGHVYRRRLACLGTGRWIETKDPYTNRVWARIPEAGAADVDAAVRAAHAAFSDGPWARMTASDRGLLLHRLGDVIAANAQELADLEVRDNGKLMVEMLGQMNTCRAGSNTTAVLPTRSRARCRRPTKVGMFNYVVHEPIGVVGAITPWNSPLLLTVWKLARRSRRATPWSSSPPSSPRPPCSGWRGCSRKRASRRVSSTW